MTGHGIAAALLMATARAAVRTVVSQSKVRTLGELMSGVNQVLSDDARHGLFMTLLLLLVDGPGGRVRWASAGHDPVIIYDPAADRFDELSGNDIPLGIEPDIPYREFRREGLAAGSVLLAGTDGIWEATNAAGEMYGKDRLRAFLRTHADRSADEIGKALDEELTRFGGDCAFRDDVTFVVVKMVHCGSGMGTAREQGNRAGARTSTVSEQL